MMRKKLGLLALIPGFIAVKNATQGNIGEAIPLTLMAHTLVSVCLIVGMVWL